jgi:hypothetical protein
MKFTIIDPTDNMLLELTAQPEEYHGIQAWRILFPEEDSFVMMETNQQWKVMDEPDVNPHLIHAIAKNLIKLR